MDERATRADGLEDHAGFAEAVRARLHEAGISQAELAVLLAKELGRDRSYSDAAVSRWLTTAPPAPPIAFAFERVLHMRPGALAAYLGYLPPSAKGSRSVLEAIDADPRLDASSKKLLAALYREATRGT